MNLLKDYDFAMWAFGHMWTAYMVFEADSIDLMKEWNRLHGHLLLLDPHNPIMDDIENMKQIWMENGKHIASEHCSSDSIKP